MLLLIVFFLFSPLHVTCFRWIDRGGFFEEGGCRFTGNVFRSEISNNCGSLCKSDSQCTHYTFHPTTKTCELRVGWKAGDGPFGTAAGQVYCGCIIDRMPNIRFGCVPEAVESPPSSVPDAITAVLPIQIGVTVVSNSSTTYESDTNDSFWKRVADLGGSLQSPMLILLNLPLFLLIVLACVCICGKVKTTRTTVFTTDFENLEDLHDNVDLLKYDKTYEISISNLELGEVIGGGHYGSVSLGVFHISRQWNRRFKIFGNFSTMNVAIKTACTTQTIKHNQLSEKMLMDELKIFCAVGKHPNVVTLLGAVTGDLHQIVLEKCDKGSLEDHLKKNRNNFVPQYHETWTQSELEELGYAQAHGQIPAECLLACDYMEPYDKEKWKVTLREKLTTSHLISYAMQIAEGMEYLVRKKCIHRDLAARNVLLTTSGLCKISDFGLAKVTRNQCYDLQRELDLPVRWMAPEAIRRATVESDIWSFAIVLYEIFSLGATPYQEIATSELQVYVKKGGRCSKPQFCHPVIYEHMEKCWLLTPENRPCFRSAVKLLEGHLFISSTRLLEEYRHEKWHETKKQKKLDELRNRSGVTTGQNDPSSNIPELC